jgi:hypothetical protein
LSIAIPGHSIISTKAAWNPLVVTCVFTGASIDTTVGLRERRNPGPAHKLRDQMAERQAAHRALPDSIHAYVANDGSLARSVLVLERTVKWTLFLGMQAGPMKDAFG